MTIDKVKLIELLVERTGLDQEKVEEQLSRLISRIQQAAEQGKSFQIEGFGTFSVKDDTLHFNPADTLETEINHKYAGMKPIELIGAFKEVPPVDEEEPEAAPEGQPPKELTEEERLVEKVLGIEGSSKPPASRQEESVADSVDDPFEEEKPKASFVFDDLEDSGEGEESAGPVSGKAKKEKKDTIGSMLIACVVILVVGLAGWALYDFGLLPFSDTGTGTSAQNNQTVQSTSNQSDESLVENFPDQPSPSADAEDSENEANPDASEQQSGNLVSNGEDTPTQAETSAYGLMGTATDRGNNGYTIVVHSLGDENTARIIQNGLKFEGFRTVLTSAVVNGSTYWRIGLGQFETVADAQEAIDMLPEQYKSDHFIRRIQ